MKKFLLMFLVIALAIIAMAATKRTPVARATKVPALPWVTTVTTNDDMTVTKVMTKGTNTVTLVYHNTEVPRKYRTRFYSMSEEDKSNALSDAMSMIKRTEVTPDQPIKSKGVEPAFTDANITDEIYIINAR